MVQRELFVTRQRIYVSLLGKMMLTQNINSSTITHMNIQIKKIKRNDIKSPFTERI